MKRSEIVEVFKNYLENINSEPIDFNKFREALQDVIWKFRNGDISLICDCCKKIYPRSIYD